MATNKQEKTIGEIDLLYTLVGRDKIKTYTLCSENICRILRHHPDFKGRVKFDAFTNFIYMKFDNEAWSPLRDHHSLRMQNEIASSFSFFQKISSSMMNEAIAVVAYENTFDSAIDYIEALKWDGVERMPTWLTTVYGVEDNEYHRSVGTNWLKGLVKRIIHPGCKFDYIFVIEGPQGSRKSSSLATLGGEWYVETFMNTESKDFFMQFQGKAIIEFSEGETLSRTDVKRMKAIITTQIDRFRAPYARYAEDYPRRCVFAMTTNETEYLKDDTGNRRWLPITLKHHADVEWIKDNRDQLLAEAYHRIVVLNETVWEFEEDIVKEEQSKRVETNPQQEMIEDWFYNTLTPTQQEEGITTTQVYVDVLHKGFPTRPISKYDEMVIAGALKNMGMVRQRKTIGNVRSWRWFIDSSLINTHRQYQEEQKKLGVPTSIDF